ncbi:MAG: rhombosortase [Gammaproteobacteria bacterium]|nr:rhombosortase [Gammaproteobacteria bacterium]MDH5693354.1 rhombosortase [Gammaproteobacteria bacterium]
MLIFPQFYLAFTIIALCLAIAASGTNVTDVLRYDRLAIGEHEYWRLISSHFVHLSWMHLLMNLLGLMLVFFFFFSVYTVRAWIGLLLFSSLLTGLLILIFNAEIRWYVGLSGTLHGLFIAGALGNLRVRRLESIALLVLLTIKLAWEQLMGPLPGSEETAGGPVLVDAHFFGAISGLIFYFLFGLLDRSKAEAGEREN